MVIALNKVKPIVFVIATVILIGILLIGFIPHYAKGSPGPAVQYTIEQNGTVHNVVPISSSDNITEFYSYNNPEAASANTGLETANTSLIFLYSNNTTGNLSLVFIHDIYDDATGGNITWVFSGIPLVSTFAVQDDPYPTEPLEWIITGGNSTVNWIWSPCCTDGGALSPLSSPFAITIEPDFFDGIESWKFLSGDLESPSEISLNLTSPITIRAEALDEIEVDIDIKPGSYPNSINLKSKGVIPVAILSTEDFDTNDVDPESVMFGPSGASPVHYAIEDVDDDGDDDMILHFRTPEVGLMEGDTEATLTGETTGGTAIHGTDSVRIVPPEGKGKGNGKPNPKSNPDAPGQNKTPGEPAQGKGKANAPGQNKSPGEPAQGKGKANAPGQNK